MSEEEFWAMPVNIFFALLKHHDRSKYESYWRMGQVCATIVNIKLKKGAKPFDPEAFIPKRFRSTEDDEPHKASPAELKQQIRAIHNSLGGRETPKKQVTLNLKKKPKKEK